MYKGRAGVPRRSAAVSARERAAEGAAQDNRRPPYLERGDGHLVALPQPERLGRQPLAQGKMPHELVFSAALHLRRAADVSGAGAARLRDHGGPGHPHFRQRGAEEIPSAAHCKRRRLVVPGFSEPEARSDLASLKTKAERKDDKWIINGQKTWTTLAQYADMVFCLCRTEPTAKEQAGISFMLVDMKSKDITVRPIQTIDGAMRSRRSSSTTSRCPSRTWSARRRVGTTPNSCSAMSERESSASASLRSATQS